MLPYNSSRGIEEFLAVLLKGEKYSRIRWLLTWRTDIERDTSSVDTELIIGWSTCLVQRHLIARDQISRGIEC